MNKAPLKLNEVVDTVVRQRSFHGWEAVAPLKLDMDDARALSDERFHGREAMAPLKHRPDAGRRRARSTPP